MKTPLKAALLLSALCATLGLCACSSDDDAKNAGDAPATDAAPAKSSDAPKKKASAEKKSFFKAVGDAFDQTKVKSADEVGMNSFKNDETTIFHKERRSDKLIENNDSIDPSYVK